jgi:DNA-binding Lrp family transcriptional regulator
MKAYIMIHVRPGSVPEVLKNLRRLEGIQEANMTFGPYDVVAVFQAVDVNQMGKQVASNVQPIPGVIDTLTCLVIEP